MWRWLANRIVPPAAVQNIGWVRYVVARDHWWARWPKLRDLIQ